MFSASDSSVRTNVCCYRYSGCFRLNFFFFCAHKLSKIMLKAKLQLHSCCLHVNASMKETSEPLYIQKKNMIFVYCRYRYRVEVRGTPNCSRLTVSQRKRCSRQARCTHTLCRVLYALHVLQHFSTKLSTSAYKIKSVENDGKHENAKR